MATPADRLVAVDGRSVACHLAGVDVECVGEDPLLRTRPDEVGRGVMIGRLVTINVDGESRVGARWRLGVDGSRGIARLLELNLGRGRGAARLDTGRHRVASRCGLEALGEIDRTVTDRGRRSRGNTGGPGAVRLAIRDRRRVHLHGGSCRRNGQPGQVCRPVTDHVIEPLLTSLARFHMDDDPGFVGLVEFLIQKLAQLFVARA